MRKIAYSITVILSIFIYVLGNFYDELYFTYPTTLVFLLVSLVMFSNITIESYRSSVMLKQTEYFYFFAVSLVMTLASFSILIRDLTFTSFKILYFYEFKYLEIILFTFALYLIRDHKQKKIYYFLFSLFLLMNVYLLFSFFRSDYMQFIPLIMFFGLYVIYFFTAVKSIKSVILEILEYNLISELIFLAYMKSSQIFLYAASLALFLFSLIRILKFFNDLIKRNYYKNQYIKEKKVNKLLELNEKPVFILQGYTIKKANSSSLKLFGLKNLGDIKNQNLFNYISTKDLGGYNLEKRLEEGEKRVTVRPVDGSELKRLVDVYRIKGVSEGEYIIEFREEANFGDFFYELNDQLEVVVYIYEKNVGYTYVSKGVEDLLGYRVEEFYNDKWFTKKISVDNKFENIIKGLEEEFSFTAKYKKKNAEIIYLKENIKEIKIGTREFLYGIVTDVTEFVDEVARINQINSDLLEKNKKKDMAMSIVSHEIRTPITAIIGFLENILINNRDIDDRTAGMIKKVYSNSMRLKELVNNLLDLNKLNAGKLELYIEKNDLTALVNEIILNNETLLEIKGLRCINNITEKVEVEADSAMLYQIINNVVSNSIKYNKDRGKIIISKEENKNDVILKIEDNGVGIPEENKEKVFMEYERVKGIKEKGTGLGLPLAKKLVELNKGKMWFESEVDKGTTFYLLFKKAKGNEINSE